MVADITGVIVIVKQIGIIFGEMGMLDLQILVLDKVSLGLAGLVRKKSRKLNVVEDAEALCEHHVGVLRSEADVGGLQLPVAKPASKTFVLSEQLLDSFSNVCCRVLG
jgi:hypothetical protein